MSDDTLQQDELTTLKARADQMGIAYHPNIGVEKLREKIADKLQATENQDTDDNGDPAPGTNDASQSDDSNESAPAETKGQRIARLRKEAAKLVRIRVTCMNPVKREHEGEIITAGNTVVGTHRKYVPFNIDEGWHVPQVILNVLKQRQCQVFYTHTDAKGNKTRKGKLIKEFAIEELPPLTEAELKELATRQAAARSID